MKCTRRVKQISPGVFGASEEHDDFGVGLLQQAAHHFHELGLVGVGGHLLGDGDAYVTFVGLSLKHVDARFAVGSLAGDGGDVGPVELLDDVYEGNRLRETEHQRCMFSSSLGLAHLKRVRRHGSGEHLKTRLVAEGLGRGRGRDLRYAEEAQKVGHLRKGIRPA